MVFEAFAAILVMGAQLLSTLVVENRIIVIVIVAVDVAFYTGFEIGVFLRSVRFTPKVVRVSWVTRCRHCIAKVAAAGTRSSLMRVIMVLFQLVEVGLTATMGRERI